MASKSAYDSDQESIDLNELPSFGVGEELETEPDLQSSGIGIASLLDAECAEERANEKMEAIVSEMQLFKLDESEAAKPFFPEVEYKYTELQQPGMEFFTSSHHHIYTQDTLLWPFGTGNNSKEAFSTFKASDVKKQIIEGSFERQFLSRKKTKLLVKYLFHLMCCTNDQSLMHRSYKTLSYLLEVNSVNVNFLNDLYLALANLGGEIAKLGKDTSVMTSPIILQSNKSDDELGKPCGVFKENKILILKFIGLHLPKSRRYTATDLEDLLKVVLAIALDPLIMDTGISIHVSNAINQIFKKYPSNQNFCEKLVMIVEHVTVYCDFDLHTVSYICSHYLMPISLEEKMLRSSLAYLQAEISLQREKKDILEFVDVVDVLDLVIERHHVFSKETDNYLLLSVMMLLDFCIGDDPLPAEQRAELQEMCNILEPTIKRRKVALEDQYDQHLRHLTDRLMIKWKQKAGQVKRQQTLTELKSNTTSDSQSSYSSGLQALQDSF